MFESLKVGTYLRHFSISQNILLSKEGYIFGFFGDVIFVVVLQVESDINIFSFCMSIFIYVQPLQFPMYRRGIYSWAVWQTVGRSLVISSRVNRLRPDSWTKTAHRLSNYSRIWHSAVSSGNACGQCEIKTTTADERSCWKVQKTKE